MTRLGSATENLSVSATGEGTFTVKNGFTAGVRFEQAEYGQAISTRLYGETAPDHTNQTGWYDHTGGASGEQMFTKISGDDFAQADADNGNWILFITGEHPRGLAEIKSYISTTVVLVEGLGWDQDIDSAGAAGSFYIIKHPGFVTGGNTHEFSVGTDGEFEIKGYGFTGTKMFDIDLEAAADGADAISMDAHANGYTGVDGLVINYESGDLAAGETGGGIRSRLNVVDATSADATTDISAYTAVQVGVPSTDATLNAYKVLPGFTNALLVEGSEPTDPNAGYEVSSGGTVETDRVNGAAGDGNAFLEAGNNLAIFDADDDYILIGSGAPFELLGVNLATPSSKNIVPTFWYTSDGAGTWSALTVTTDGTHGFTQSGLITFNEPGGWAKDDQSPDGSAITNEYWIAIRRTYAPVIAVKPVEDYFKTFEDKETGMKIDGHGFITPRISADADAPNISIYYSTDQSKLVFKDSGGVVRDLY